MKIMLIVLLVVLLVLVAVTSVQGQVVEEYRLEFIFTQGNFGEWYAYCIDGCERLLGVASVNEIHQSFSNVVGAMNHSLVLTGRVYGFTPDLFPVP